jgi:hypothetical protein
MRFSEIPDYINGESGFIPPHLAGELVDEHDSRDIRPEWRKERDRVDLVNDNVKVPMQLGSIAPKGRPMNGPLVPLPDNANPF